MSYPKHFQQLVDRRWAARLPQPSNLRGDHLDRRSGSNCACGHRAVGPVLSIYIKPGLIEHQWTCVACGRQWNSSVLVPSRRRQLAQ
jgi:hypothetical protein